MKEIILGKSVKGKDIVGYIFGNENSFNKTLVFGGIHGNEIQSKEFCDLYIEEIKDKPFPNDCFLILIPEINPDGLEVKSRVNANGVDLNRNFPSNSWQSIPLANHSSYYPGAKAASEPETQIIVNLLNKYNFKKIISIHTNAPIQFPNPPMVNYDGKHSRELAEKISHAVNLPSYSDIGYPTPGSIGPWVGDELKKISVTLELDYTKSTEELYKKHKGVFAVGIHF